MMQHLRKNASVYFMCTDYDINHNYAHQIILPFSMGTGKICSTV